MNADRNKKSATISVLPKAIRGYLRSIQIRTRMQRIPPGTRMSNDKTEKIRDHLRSLSDLNADERR